MTALRVGHSCLTCVATTLQHDFFFTSSFRLFFSVFRKEVIYETMAQQFAFHGTIPGLGDKLDEVLQQQREFATQMQNLAAAVARIENRLDKASAPAPPALAPSSSTARSRIDLSSLLKPVNKSPHTVPPHSTLTRDRYVKSITAPPSPLPLPAKRETRRSLLPSPSPFQPRGLEAGEIPGSPAIMA